MSPGVSYDVLAHITREERDFYVVSTRRIHNRLLLVIIYTIFKLSTVRIIIIVLILLTIFKVLFPFGTNNKRTVASA